MPTIRDVAAEAKVSVATVSRILNDSETRAPSGRRHRLSAEREWESAEEQELADDSVSLGQSAVVQRDAYAVARRV